jgi:hypothetical protein
MTDRLDSPRLAREGSAPRYRLEAAVDAAVPRRPRDRGLLEQARAELAKDEAKSDQEPSL